MAGAMANAVETIAETGGTVKAGGVTINAVGQNAVETAAENGMMNGGGTTIAKTKAVAMQGGACPAGKQVGFLSVNADMPPAAAKAGGGAAKAAVAKPAAAVGGSSGFHLGLGLGLGVAGPLILAGLITGGVYFYMKNND